MAVPGIGSAGAPQQTNNDSKVDDAKLQAKVDQAKLDQQLTQQAKASPAQMQALLQQLQAQQLQAQQQNGGPEAIPEAVQVKANAIAAQVMNQLLGSMPSQQTAGSSGGGMENQEQGSNASSGGLGSTTSNMGASDPADAQIRRAAQATVYSDIYKLLQKMQNTRETKQALDEKISSINEALAGKRPGDKVKVPVWEYNQESGKIEFKGLKEMDYEQAVVMRDKLKDTKEAMSELSQEDMFWMQRLMEQKTQLEQMLSNVMKANSDAQSGIISNTKAS